VTFSTLPMEKLGLPIVSVDGAFRLSPSKTLCHGFQNACVCSGCMERESKPALKMVRQPWELEAA
jgi:hypothetical protein